MGNLIQPQPIQLSIEEEYSVLEHDVSVTKLVEYIKSGKAKNIVLMTGSGISVSAGIPDFRSKDTGLYANLQKYNLPNPEAVFSIEYFRENPTAFYDLSRDLLPDNYKPTPFHFFIKLLENKGILRRCYTQNIDTLERLAGVKPELLVEAHGSFGSSKCTICSTCYPFEYFTDKIINCTDNIKDINGNIIPWCKCNQEGCDGNVKPEIVFFGEGLPERYFDLRQNDLEGCDLLIVAGTSLKVAPFSKTLDLCNPKVPRLLINLEEVGTPTLDSNGNGFLFNNHNNYRDVDFLTTCDNGIFILCELLGWRSDLEQVLKESYPELSYESNYNFDSSLIDKISKSSRDPNGDNYNFTDIMNQIKRRVNSEIDGDNFYNDEDDSEDDNEGNTEDNNEVGDNNDINGDYNSHIDNIDEAFKFNFSKDEEEKDQ
jgi:NAD-dependent deacetylase sirtuin 2